MITPSPSSALSRRVSCLTGLLLSLALLATVVLGSPEAVAGEDDYDIARRVRQAVEALEGLMEVEVDVAGGVVTLRGQAVDAQTAERAESVVRKVDGVLEVQNNLALPETVSERLAPAWQRVYDVARRTWTWMPLFGVAFLVVLLFWGLARILGHWDWLFRRLSKNRFAQDLIRQIVRALIVIAGLVLALEILDATAIVGAVLGAAGLAGLAVGLAFRDLFENYLASVLLSIRRPFSPGDHVQIGDDEGNVVGLTTRSTLLRTLDGNQLRILNTDVYKSRILNYTRDPLRRFDFAVGMGVQEDLAAARRLGIDTLRAMDGVVVDPGPSAVVEELGDSSVLLRLYGWVDQRAVDFRKARGEAIRLVKQAFDAARFDMPEPIQRIRIERAAHPAEVSRPRTGPAHAEAIERDTHVEAEIERDRAALGDNDLMQDEPTSLEGGEPTPPASPGSTATVERTA